jgi:hypothetical protein
MNQTDKKELQKVIKQLSTLSPILNEMVDKVKEREQLQSIIENLKSIEPTLEIITDEAIVKAENLTDRQRDTYKGETIEKIGEDLQSAFDKLQECISYLEYTIEE